MDFQNLKSILNQALATSTEAEVQAEIQSAIDLIDGEANRTLEQHHNDTYDAIQDLLTKAKNTDMTNKSTQRFFGYSSKGDIIKNEVPYSQIKDN